MASGLRRAWRWSSLVCTRTYEYAGGPGVLNVEERGHALTNREKEKEGETGTKKGERKSRFAFLEDGVGGEGRDRLHA